MPKMGFQRSSTTKISRRERHGDQRDAQANNDARESESASRLNVGSEIDTEVECEHVGMIPDVELKHSSLESQESVGRSFSKERAESVFYIKRGERWTEKSIGGETQRSSREGKRDHSRWVIAESNI